MVPSQTEFLFDLGLGPNIVGVTRFCVHPPSAKKDKKIIGGTKNVNLKRVDKLQPDFVLANKEENVKDQVLAINKTIPTHVTDVKNIRDAIQMMNEVGVLLGKSSEAHQITEKITNLRGDHHSQPSNTTALYLIWKEPYMSVGGDTFINDMMLEAGLTNILQNQLRYPTLSLEEIKQLQPDVILLSSEPYNFTSKDQLELQAEIPQSKIILANGEMFSWYGSRMIKGIPYVHQLSQQW